MRCAATRRARGTMKITVSMSDTPHRDSLVVYADPREAEADQSIMGSRWECPRDMNVGYAVIDNHDERTEARLVEAGYTLALDGDEIVPPIKSCAEAHCNDQCCPWKDA